MVIIDNSLSRADFKKKVIEKTKGKCCVPGCCCEATDAHHILDRRLWLDGGNYLSNGASLCSQHHIEADKGIITSMQCIEYMNIDLCDLHKPDKVNLDWHEYIELLTENKLNKWGE